MQNVYREIGHGHCGSVWTNEYEDGTLVIKREDGGTGRSIQKDAEMHQRIQTSLTSAKISRLNIPAYHRLVDAQDVEFWGRRLPRFPHDATHQYEACAALISERIQPSRNLTARILSTCIAQRASGRKSNAADQTKTA